jgi:hypothetical protein
MKLVTRVAAAAAFSLLASVGAAQGAAAQAPLEIDLTGVDALIIATQDAVQQLASDLGDVTENLGQQPGVNEVLSFAGYLLTDGLIDLVQAFIDAVNP